MSALKKSSLYLPEELHRNLKIMAARLDMTINQCLEVAVKEWLKRVTESQADKVENQ